MGSRRWSSAVIALAVAAGTQCTSPAAPDEFGEPPEGTHQSSLFAVVGPGTGGVSVTSIETPERVFHATIRVRLRARANTTYIVQRAAEIGREGGADGVCQRAAGISPWSASDPPFGTAFVSFPLPFDGPIETITTSATGEAARDFIFRSTIPAGTVFDVQMRLVDDAQAPTTELRSACMTVIVR